MARALQHQEAALGSRRKAAQSGGFPTQAHTTCAGLGLIVCGSKTSGWSAAVELARHKFDLVVSDLDMEDGNGFWLHCFVSEYHTSTPLVFFTGDPEKASQLKTSRKVFDKLKIDSLFDEVKKLLNQNQDIGGA